MINIKNGNSIVCKVLTKRGEKITEEESIEEVELSELYGEECLKPTSDIEMSIIEEIGDEELASEEAYLTYNRGSFTGLQTKLVILNPDCSNGKDIDSQTVFIPAPRGSRQGFAFILAWDIHFGCSTGYGTDHHFGRQYISITSQRWIGTGLLITVKSMLRDKNGSDRWKGALRIGAAFFS